MPPPQDSAKLSQAELQGPPSVASSNQYDENGVDLSLLRYMLQLSPLERLRLMEQKAREMSVLYEYGRRHREAQSNKHR